MIVVFIISYFLDSKGCMHDDLSIELRIYQ